MRLHSSLLVLPLACLPVCGFAQTVNLGNDRAPMPELHGLVRFHIGDDPGGKLGWADPGFARDAAEEIASVTRRFGREDDITVLTLTFAPAEVLRA